MTQRQKISGAAIAAIVSLTLGALYLGVWAQNFGAAAVLLVIAALCAAFFIGLYRLSNDVAAESVAFNAFVRDWKAGYREKLMLIPLFDPEQTRTWTWEQRQQFIRLFYHARGHFSDFLWLLASREESRHRRRIIVENISDELGIIDENDRPHEALFATFAHCFEVSIDDDPMRTAYLPFLREFNDGHLQWIREHGGTSNWGLFAAYELLDEIDYESLLALAKSIGVNGQALGFFEVHTKGDHYSKTWSGFPYAASIQEQMMPAFTFIAEHQLKMWQGISDAVFEAREYGNE